MLDNNLLGQGVSIDAYIKTVYLGNKLKTQTITAKKDVPIEWNTEFLVRKISFSHI